ncbi:MAG TPA: hypothetical protein VMY77_02685 [Chitinophagaceae bacterium]|nr:hypothetical protein [Chitinophagaceae bacterium]
MTPIEEQLEALQKKHDRFVNRVTNLRYWQKQYDMFHAGLDYPRKRIMEREIDKMLLEEQKEKRSKQLQLR